MVFITLANSNRILANLDFKDSKILKGPVYIKPIKFFNSKETHTLLSLMELLKNPEQFISECYVKIKNTDTLKYVFEGIPPAYHLTPNCKRINSKYINFEIPDEIKVKGLNEIMKFRNWFKANQEFLEKPDMFSLKLQQSFGIQIEVKEINYKNSGHEIKDNLDLEALEIRINKYLSEADEYFNNSDYKKKNVIIQFQKLTFLAYSKKPIYNNNSGYSDQAIKKFLLEYDRHFKRPVKDLLFEYYKVKYNPDLKFEGYLLEQLGFKPCHECHNKA